MLALMLGANGIVHGHELLPGAVEQHIDFSAEHGAKAKELARAFVSSRCDGECDEIRIRQHSDKYTIKAVVPEGQERFRKSFEELLLSYFDGFLPGVEIEILSPDAISADLLFVLENQENVDIRRSKNFCKEITDDPLGPAKNSLVRVYYDTGNNLAANNCIGQAFLDIGDIRETRFLTGTPRYAQVIYDYRITDALAVLRATKRYSFSIDELEKIFANIDFDKRVLKELSRSK